MMLLVFVAIQGSHALLEEADLSESQDPTEADAPQDVGDEIAGGTGPPPQVMLGTSGIFKLASEDSVPQVMELDLDLGESSSLARHHGDGRVTLEEASKILSIVGEAADPHATLSRAALDTLIKRATKDRVLGGKGYVVGAVHDANPRGIRLGETAGVRGGFRYTNGVYGGNGGKEKWLKCVSACEGSGYGGYGYCSVAGEGNSWGGCMAPGSDPAVERPPRLYAKNRVTTSEQPRAHQFCDAEEGGDVWFQSGGTLVAGCNNCLNQDYFLVPNHHVENMMVGSCFKIDQYDAWVEASQVALTGYTAPLSCSVFTNGKGMRSQYFGGQNTDEWDSAPKASPFNPRAFLCTTAGSVHDHTVEGLLSKGYREMRVFATTVARFVMCYTNTADGVAMKCVKKTRIGKCNSFYVRNAAFDQGAFHLGSPPVNQTGIDWDAATKKWDKEALTMAVTRLMQPENSPSIGFRACDESWNERILAVHQ